MPATKTPDLQERREKLNAKLGELQSQHVDIVRDLEAAQQDWAAAVEAGKSTTAIVERRRHREGELEENQRQAEHFGQLLAEVDAELQRRVPHEVLDRRLIEHAARVESSAEFVATEVVGAPQREHDLLVAAVDRLTGVIAKARADYVRDLGETQQLRAMAAQLGRVDLVIPSPVDWESPLIEEMRGTSLQGLTLDLLRVNTHRHDVASSLGNTVRTTIYNRDRR